MSFNLHKRKVFIKNNHATVISLEEYDNPEGLNGKMVISITNSCVFSDLDQSSNNIGKLNTLDFSIEINSNKHYLLELHNKHAFTTAIILGDCPISSNEIAVVNDYCTEQKISVCAPQDSVMNYTG
jgi:hypothetical protein